MAVKLSKHIAKRGISVGLEEKFSELGLGEEDIVGRVKYLAKSTYPPVQLSENITIKGNEITAIRLANGRYVRISDVNNLPKNELNEIYRKLYAQRSRNLAEAL